QPSPCRPPAPRRRFQMRYVTPSRAALAFMYDAAALPCAGLLIMKAGARCWDGSCPGYVPISVNPNFGPTSAAARAAFGPTEPDTRPDPGPNEPGAADPSPDPAIDGNDENRWFTICLGSPRIIAPIPEPGTPFSSPSIAPFNAPFAPSIRGPRMSNGDFTEA